MRNPYGELELCAGNFAVVFQIQCMNPKSLKILLPASNLISESQNPSLFQEASYTADRVGSGNVSAQQSVGLVKDRTVIIIPTKTIAQGASAILSYNPDLDSQENAELMTKAASKVKTGQITFAARDSEFGGFKIRENDILALSDGKLLFTEKNPMDAAVNLAKKIVNKETEFITLIYGEGINAGQAEEVKERIEKSLKNSAEITLVEGNQPIYHFIISVE